MGAKSKKCNNMFKEISSLFYDVPVLNTSFQYVPLLAHAPDTASVSGGREGVNPRNIILNMFLLKSVTLFNRPTGTSANLQTEHKLYKSYIDLTLNKLTFNKFRTSHFPLSIL
jgi:hypothetical protein